MRVYLDTAPIIYLVEQNPTFSPAVATKLAALGGDLVTSEMSWVEALVHPYRMNDASAIADFDHFFRNRLTEIIEINRAVCDRAARIRAAHNFKTPDALHLAAAVEAGCDVFLTNDQQLKQFTGIAVEVI